MERNNIEQTIPVSAASNETTFGEPYITFASIFDEEDQRPAEADALLDDLSMEGDNGLRGNLQIAAAIGALPDLLKPEVPPPFAKDRVMSHLQEPIVAIFVPKSDATSQTALRDSDPEQWQMPVSGS